MGERISPGCGKSRRSSNAAWIEPRHTADRVATLFASALLTCLLAVALFASPAWSQDNERRIEALESQNEALQRQNEELQRQMELLRQDLQAIKQAVQQLPAQAVPAPESAAGPAPVPVAVPESVAGPAPVPVTAPESAAGPAPVPVTRPESVAGPAPGPVAVPAPGPVAAHTPPPVTSGQERVKLSISGHVHRAMNVAKDGDRTKVYHVDPDSSNSRFRLVGSAQLIDGVELGTNIEIGVRPNSSGDVSQDNEESGDDFDQRIVEMTVNGRFGKMSFGKGSTASDNTAQVDLSGTNVILYSAVNHPVGGLKFVDEDGELTDVRINDVFNNFDGLGREDRIQYDSPTIAGFSFGTTYASDQRADAAIRWAAEIGDFKAAAAGSIFDPSKAGVDYGWAGSTSILHKETGLNLTFSSGAEKTDSGGDRNQIYLKGGWIANIFDFGSSNFGVHGARTSNLPTPSDDAWTFGAAFVQKLDDFGAELYTKFSIYDLDRDNDASVDQIHALTVGSRVKF